MSTRRHRDDAKSLSRKKKFLRSGDDGYYYCYDGAGYDGDGTNNFEHKDLQTSDGNQMELMTMQQQQLLLLQQC